MTKEDRGHYAAKHGNVRPDERIAAAVSKKASGGKLLCGAAERLAAELGVAMADIGRNADLLEIRISGCQLGLFGHTREEKAVRPAQEVTPALEALLRSRRAGGPKGLLACTACWEIAALEGLSRLEVAAACEKLGIKIKPCQLGAF